MPHSLDESRPLLGEWLRKNSSEQKVLRVLDVGAGAGTYASFVREHWTGDTHLTAIEVWEPYVDQFALRSVYDTVVLAEFTQAAQKMLAADDKFDLVIFGDVLEHFVWDEALAAWELGRALAGPDGTVFVSAPTEDYPQGTMFGNHYESHLCQFTRETLSSLPGVFDFFPGTVVSGALAMGRQIGQSAVD